MKLIKVVFLDDNDRPGSEMVLQYFRYAVVAGGNKGIGFEICRQLAKKGVTVILTARDEKRGIEAVKNLKESGLTENVVFHQLDVTDPSGIASLADFVKNQFGRLDILVNNAGIPGAHVNFDALKILQTYTDEKQAEHFEWSTVATETYELVEECLETNYYGAKRLTEALAPLLQLSNSARIVNVTSAMGRLQNFQNEWAKRVLGDAEGLTDDRIDEVMREYLKDFKEGLLEKNGWPEAFSGYIVSKAAMNANTRLVARKYPNFCVNCVNPGFIRTDINGHMGTQSVEHGGECAVRLALLPTGGPSGLYFSQKEVSYF
ncbi:Short-chain dehydrogenase/reductase SDR [Dillenia turbinata]|uniref:Short-chain dehydrogenase/reductase n=1 Tax=Dillenia turbinata TaxID=194707 RepID=A0AAN8UVI9_9MAGN